MVLFPNTNIFLQCRLIRQLSWGELAAEREDIAILVASPVVDELDKLKSDGNGRRARRAREANSLFKQILAADQMVLVLHDSNPRITISFAPELPADFRVVKPLDSTRMDDRLIAEVLHFQQNTKQVCIVSADIGMRIRGKRHGVQVTEPPESWFLPPENDDRDKELARLQSENAALRSTEATLSIDLHHSDVEIESAVADSLPMFPELKTDETAYVLGQISSRYPMRQFTPIEERDETTLQGLLASIGKFMPSQNQIDDYTQRYKKWWKSVTEKLEGFALLQNARERVVRLTLNLANAGAKPADEVLLEIEVFGPCKICAFEEDDIPSTIKLLRESSEDLVIPKLPVPPPDSQLGLHSYLQDFGHSGLFGPSYELPKNIRPISRDRHSLYRREAVDSPAQSCTFECEELRHQRDPIVVSLWIFVAPSSDVQHGKLHIRASARNQSYPLDRYIDISVSSRAQNTYEAASRFRVEADRD